MKRDMDIKQLVQELFSLKTIFLSLGIGVIIYFIRLFVEKIPGVKKVKTADKDGTHILYSNKFSEWWNDVILYALPIVLGVLIGGLAKQTFWPEFAPTRLGGIFYGAIAGWASGFVYRIVKKLLSGSGSDGDADSTKNDADPEPEPKKDAEPDPESKPGLKKDAEPTK